jgi:AcrR family transcriptional regulator
VSSEQARPKAIDGARLRLQAELDPEPEPEPEPVSVWLRPERKTRRRQPRTRREVAKAAITVVDRDGPDALTMRRVAAQLGIATMSLYSYVADKDELLDLVADEMLGEIVVEEELPSDWREALTLIARRTRAFFLNHPWVISYLDHADPAVGPNMLRHMEQSLAAVASLELDPLQRQSVPRVVDEYVFGAALNAIDDQIQREYRKGADPARAAGSHRFVQLMVESGQFPHIAETMREGVELPYLEEPLESSEARFERGLGWLLDGIAAAAAAAARARQMPSTR